MTRLTLTALCLLLLAGDAPTTSAPGQVARGVAALAVGQTADLKLPAEVKGGEFDYLMVRAETSGSVVRWYPIDVGLKLFPPELLKDTKTAVVSGPKGRYRLLAYTSVKDVATEPAICVVVIGDAPPTVPVPGPTPGPAPGPVPIPLPGLRVLIVYETDAGPPELNLIVSGEKVRSYMAEKGVKGGFLALDKDLTDAQIAAAGQEQWVRDAYKRRPATYSVPWAIISNGTTGFEGPLPLTVTGALELFRKFGG